MSIGRHLACVTLVLGFGALASAARADDKITIGFVTHSQGDPFIQQIIDGAQAAAERLRRRRAPNAGQDRPDLAPGPLRERVEQALAIGNASAWGYALGREGWMGALAREPSAAFDAGIRRALAAMLRAHVLGE